MKHGNSQTGKLPIFRERLRQLRGDMYNDAFAKKIGLARQTVGFYLNGDRIPDALTLSIIAKKCEVSSDWLLGLAKEKSINPDIRTVVEVTGLSEKSIDVLRELSDKDYPDFYIRTLDWFLSNMKFSLLLVSQINSYKEICHDLASQKEPFENTFSEVISGKVCVEKEDLLQQAITVSETEDSKDLALFRINRLFNDILDAYIDGFSPENLLITEENGKD